LFVHGEHVQDFIWKLQGKEELGGYRQRREDNIKIDLREIRYEV
jgi:hypothetical protein